MNELSEIVCPAYADDTYGYREAQVEAEAEPGLPLPAFPANAPGRNVITNPPRSEEDIPER